MVTRLAVGAPAEALPDPMAPMAPEPLVPVESTPLKLITVIEEARAVDRIDEIAATPGIDVLFIGTTDLSFSLGLRGRQDEPLLDEAIKKIVAAGRRHKKFLGRPAILPERIPQFREQGFQFFQCTTELGLMAMGARQILDGVSKLQPAGERSLY